ncbi:MAG: hypothetical protein AABY87_04400 [bacterium]
MLHNIFNARQKADYREFIDAPLDEARGYVRQVREFLDRIKQFCGSE